MKYIRVDDSFNTMYVFPDHIAHSEMARNIRIPKDEIVSAGFVGIEDNLFKCFGKSVSLDKQSLQDDTQTLNCQMIPGYSVQLIENLQAFRQGQNQ